MSTNNDVCKVLFLPEKTGNAAGDRISDLTTGKWGVFDYDTGLTVDISAATASVKFVVPRNFFIAYMGDGTLGVSGKIYTSAATHVQRDRIQYYTTNTDAAALGQTILLNEIDVESGATATNYDYGVKLDFRGNTEVYTRFGANQASKTFMANTKCVGTGTASSYDGAEVVAQIAQGIANDDDQFLNVTVTGTGVAGPVIAADAFINYVASGIAGTAGKWYEGATNVLTTEITEAQALTGIRKGTADVTLTIVTQTFSSLYTFCNVNPKYFKQRQIAAVPSVVGGDCAWGTIAQTVAMIYERGRGYDIQELEYLDNGFGGNSAGPYRQSNLNGLPFTAASFIADKDKYYTVCALSYMNMSVAGWMEHLNSMSTYFVLDGDATAGNSAPAPTAAFPKAVLDSIALTLGITEVSS